MSIFAQKIPKNSSFQLFCAALVLVCCVILIFDQIVCWNSKDDYLFGYLVPFFAAFVIKERWPKISQIFTNDAVPEEDLNDEFSLPDFVKSGVPAPRWLNFLFVAGTIFSLLIFSSGALGSAIYGIDAFTTYQNTAGFCGICIGAAWFASEKNFEGTTNDLRTRSRLLLLLVFPIFVWLISGPFTFLVDRQIKSILLTNVTGTVVHLLNFAGFDVAQEANTIVLGNGEKVGVEDACSGVRSLTACVFAGSFLAAIFLHSVKKKIFFVALSVVGALFLNVLRTSALTLWAIFNGANSIEFDFFGNAPDSENFTLGTVHDVLGWAAMFITLFVMIALVPVVNIKLRKTDEEMQISFVDDDEN